MASPWVAHHRFMSWPVDNKKQAFQNGNMKLSLTYTCFELVYTDLPVIAWNAAIFCFLSFFILIIDLHVKYISNKFYCNSIQHVVHFFQIGETFRL